MTRTKSCQAGQATTELVFSALGSLVFFSLLLGGLYLTWASSCLRFSSHEFLLCREFQNPVLCEKKFKSELTSYWRFGKWTHLQSSRTDHKQSVSLNLELSILGLEKIQWKYQDEIHLPLKY